MGTPAAGADEPHAGPGSVRGYGVALASIVVACLLRWALEGGLQGRVPFVGALAAVLIATLYGGIGPGLLATAIGGAFGLWVSLLSFPWHDHRADNLLGLAVYLATAGLILVAGEGQRRARRRAEASRLEATRQRDAARASERRLAVTLRSIGDAVITTDAQGHLTFLNPVAEAITGWPLTEAIGRPSGDVFRIISAATREPVASPVARVLREGIIVGLANHTLLVRRDGTEVPIDDSGAPIQDDRGTVSGVVLVFRDVSERYAAEVTQQKLAAIVESSDDAIVGTTIEGTITAWNPGAERLYGYTAQEMLGQPIGLILPPGDESEAAAITERLKRGEHVASYEATRLRKDGVPVHVSVSLAPVHGATGDVVGISAIARDVTEARREREARRRSEELLQTTLRSIGDAVIATDADERITFMNATAAELTGWPASEAIGRPCAEVFRVVHEQTREAVESPSSRALREGRIVGLANHSVLLRRDGGEVPIDDSGAPIRDETGRVFGAVLVFRDVTARRQTEQRLSRQAQLLELAHDAVLVHDLDNRLMFWNPAAEALYGWTRDEAVGQLAYELLGTEFPLPFDQVRAAIEARGTWEGELAHTRRDGTRIVVQSRWALQRDDEGTPLAVLEINRDITAQQQAAEALHASEEHYRSLYRALNEGMALHQVVCDEAGMPRDYRILDVNPAFETITCIPRERAIGSLASELYGTGEPPYLDVYAEVARSGEPTVFETAFAPMAKSFRIAVFSPAAGQFATVFEDVSERRQREEEIATLNARLRRAMSETHHRVKNNLQVIAALVDMQAMKDQASVPAGELQRLGRHVRGLAAVHDLLTQEARANGDVEFVHTTDALGKLRPLLEAMVGGRELRFHAEDLRLPVRQGTALAVLVNELVSNAVKHGEGDIDLSLAVVGDHACLEIRDHGKGFPEDFDPVRAASTGLELIESVGRWDLQGEVSYANAPGGGARITVRFPLAKDVEP